MRYKSRGFGKNIKIFPKLVWVNLGILTMTISYATMRIAWEGYD
jgi:hypothetical protein